MLLLMMAAEISDEQKRATPCKKREIRTVGKEISVEAVRQKCPNTVR